MNEKEIVKRFYEDVITNNKVDEVSILQITVSLELENKCISWGLMECKSI